MTMLTKKWSRKDEIVGEREWGLLTGLYIRTRELNKMEDSVKIAKAPGVEKLGTEMVKNLWREGEGGGAKGNKLMLGNEEGK